MMQLIETLDTNQIKVFSVAENLKLMKEDEFFKNRDLYSNDYLPLPRNVFEWHNGLIYDTPCLIHFSEIEVYAIIELQALGLSICHWVNQGNGVYRVSLPYAYRIINNKRRLKTMAENLTDMLREKGSDLNLNSINNMNAFGGQVPQQVPQQYTQPPMQPQVPMQQPQVVQQTTPQPTGVTGRAMSNNIRNHAKKYGYLFGYIMKSAPATNLGTQTDKDTKDVTIVAKQSKPSQIVNVLIAIPKKCCMHAGVLATPTEIIANSVDFNSYKDDDLAYLMLPKEAAVSYVHALGNILPEYAPTADTTGTRKEHWSPIEIASKNPDVTYVASHITKRSGSKGGYNHIFRTDAPRKSLYTQKNIMCLTAQEHVQLKNHYTEEQCYEYNEYAFGHHRNRAPRKNSGATEGTDSLTLLESNCPTQIWAHEYIINGEKTPGIMSCFFMPGDSIKKDNSDSVIPKAELEFRPWWETGKLKTATLTTCKSIVKRELDTKSGRRVPKKVSYIDNPNHAMFKPYEHFVNLAKEKGFLRDEDIASMCSTASSRKVIAVSKEVDSMLDQQLKSSELVAMVEDVINDYSVRNSK